MIIDIMYEQIHNLYEMARIGCFRDNDVCVYGGEGCIPHMHLKNRQTEKECCIRIDEAEYFEHGDREFFKLNSKEKKEFIKWLKLMHDSDDIIASNWVWIRITWNDNNPTYKIEKGTTMPDYTKLN